MRVLLDASSVINLINGEVLPTILQMTGITYYLGDIAQGECEEPFSPIVAALIKKDLIAKADDSDLPASLFLQLSQKYGLGDGETECLAFGSVEDYIICSDDLKARKTVASLYGKNRLTGSIGLLTIAVEQSFLTSEQAYNAYRKMKRKGGYLPLLKANYFG